MASRRSFSVRSLLTETPRSNRSRLSFFMKRGSRSTSGHRIKRLFKSEILDSSPKARRNLALGSQRSLQLVIGPLVAKEAEVFEEHVSITMSKNSRQCALFGKYVAIVQEKYPALSSRVISSPSIQQICWLEILSPVLIHDATLGPVSCLRLIISSEGVGSLQVLYPFMRRVWQRVVTNDCELIEVVNMLLPESGYVYCPGISVVAYRDFFEVLHYHSKEVHCILEPPIERYEANDCRLWHKPAYKKTKMCHPMHDSCNSCKKVYSHLTQLTIETIKCDPEHKASRIDASSNYSWNRLSPGSQQLRRCKVAKERRDYKAKAQVVSSLSGITLDDEHAKEMAEVVCHLSENETGRSHLETIFKEADSSGEGRGAVLKSMWDEAKERAAFFKDQKSNKTGQSGNRWSLVTYRIALAVYSRSPAAFEALKSLNILQLPSRSSVQAFLSSHQNEPGVKEESLALQFKLYAQHKAERSPTPAGDGILIFDEVRVQGKVIWNSKNNQILGMAMNSDDLPSLHDVYSLIDEEEKIKETHYMLQFVWRDLSSKFDIIGPYYSSAQGFDSKFTMACLQDALFFFEAYSFHVLAIVGDGASWNHTVFKRLCGHSGKFGTKEDEANNSIHAVPASFTNPYTGSRVCCMVCPSHELKSMVSALYNSGDRRTKHFFKSGSFFGWKTIEDLWQREIKRSEAGQMMVVPRLKASHVFRDSWTRLNVSPAKIMQQDKVIAEIKSNSDSPSDELTVQYLEALNKIFENGLLSKSRVFSSDADPLTNMQTGLSFLESWCDECIEQGGNPKDETQTTFLAWQTWDLIRLTIEGFTGLCNDFLTRNPGHFIKPSRVNGSVIESLFGRFKYNAGGHLSSVNYRGCVAKLIIADAVNSRESYKGENCNHQGALIKKTYKRKN